MRRRASHTGWTLPLPALALALLCAALGSAPSTVSAAAPVPAAAPTAPAHRTLEQPETSSALFYAEAEDHPSTKSASAITSTARPLLADDAGENVQQPTRDSDPARAAPAAAAAPRTLAGLEPRTTKQPYRYTLLLENIAPNTTTRILGQPPVIESS